MSSNSWSFNLSNSKKINFINNFHVGEPIKKLITYYEEFVKQSDTDLKKLKQIYQEQHANFRMTPRSEVMIRRIIKYSSIPREYLAYPLIKIIIETVCEMMMSEIEIVGFCIYLKRFIWPINTNHSIILLYTVAFGVKYYFSKNIDPVLAHIRSKIPNFLKIINLWINRNEDELKIGYPELNKTFEQLIK